MTKRLTGFSVFAITLLLLASFPMFNKPSAVAQSEEGGLGACVARGQCFETTAENCAFEPGLWYGEGSFCVVNQPAMPPGNLAFSSACCLGDGTCAVIFPTLCVEAGGTASPQGTPCSQVTCDQPCYGDVDGDGTVGIGDFLDLLAAWGDCK